MTLGYDRGRRVAVERLGRRYLVKVALVVVVVEGQRGREGSGRVFGQQVVLSVQSSGRVVVVVAVVVVEGR
jgi:hypothetical protein